jgi:hypothetical protein
MVGEAGLSVSESQFKMLNQLQSQFNNSNNSAIQVLFSLVESLAESLVNLLLESSLNPDS